MAATMDHETTSTTASEQSGNGSSSEDKVAEMDGSNKGTVGDSSGPVETDGAAKEHGNSPARMDMETEGDVELERGAGDRQAVEVESPESHKQTEGSDSGSARESKSPNAGASSGEEAFKLPGLPLLTKPLVKKTNSPVVRSNATKPGSDPSLRDASGPASQSAALPSSAKGTEADKSTHTGPGGETDFAFAIPKQAAGGAATKAARLPKSDQPVGNGSGEFQVPDSEQPAEPQTTAAKKPREKSPAEALKKAPPLPYKEPPWSGLPADDDYRLEVLKGGAIVSEIPLAGQPYHVFGRLETCDVPLEHPSLSRHHLVLQYRATGDGQHGVGFYLYDLGSTHGSWFNKQRMEARVYYRMRVGHMFKLGGSTRLYVLQGPAEDQEEESNLSVKELRELRQQQLAQMEERKRQKKLEKEEEEEEADRRKEKEEKDAGITWGMDYEDAADEDAMGDNPYAVAMTQEEKEATYVKDPKKALRGYFEREGYDLEYNVDEKESGFSKQFVCKVELPIDDASGRPIVAEVAVAGKKKEAVAACALEACRILDAHGVLRQATHESHKRKTKDWKEDDFYDSDEDTFLDRTGEIEKKRMQRMKKAGVIKEKAQTYESLKTELADVDSEIQKLEAEVSATGKTGAGSSMVKDDSLDAFMESIKSGRTVDKTWRARMKLRLIQLRKDQARLRRLVDIARPASMPALNKPPASQTTFAALSKKLPMFGSMKGRTNLKSKLRPAMPQPKTVPLPIAVATAPEEEEVEEEDAGEVEEEEEGQPEGLVSPPASQASPQQMDCAQPTEVPTQISRGVTDTEAKPKSLSESSSKLDSIRHIRPSSPIQVGRVSGKDTAEQDKTLRESGPPPRQAPGTGKDPRVPDQREPTAVTKKKPRLAVGPLKARETEEREDKEDFADWMPPVGQTGDGKTHLNAKYGY